MIRKYLINSLRLNQIRSHQIRSLSVNQSNRRVVVTGLGCLSPLGTRVENVWSNLIDGKIGVSKLEDKSYDQIPCKVAAFIPKDELNLDQHFSTSELKSLSRNSLLTLLASKMAIEDSKIDLTYENLNRIGVAIGTGMIDLSETSQSILTFNEKGYKKLNPHFITKLLLNMPAGHVSIKYKLKGPNHSVTTACTTGLHSIGIRLCSSRLFLTKSS